MQVHAEEEDLSNMFFPKSQLVRAGVLAELPWGSLKIHLFI